MPSSYHSVVIASSFPEASVFLFGKFGVWCEPKTKLTAKFNSAPRGVLVKENFRGVSFFYVEPKKNIHYQKTEDGRMVLFDEDRKVIGTQKMSKANQLRVAQGKKPVDFSGITRHTWKKNKNGVPLFVQSEMDATDLPDDFELYPQTEEMMLCVVQLVADGKTLKTIGQTPGLPPVSVVMRWANKSDEFKTMLAEARKSRAEVYHDAIEYVAFNAKEHNAKSSKVKIDALKFLASVNDRDRFGQQAKVAVDVNTPINIIFHTGIEREKPIEAEAVTQEPVKLDDIKPSKD